MGTEPQAVKWMGTLWPKNLLKHENLKQWFDWFKIQKHEGVRYAVAQMERATTTERIHIQLYMHWSKVKRPSYIGKKYGVQAEVFQVANGEPAENRAYCTDEHKRVEGTESWDYGICPGSQGSKLTIVAATIKKHGIKRAVKESPQTYITNGRGMRDLDRFYKRAKLENRITRQINVWVVYGQSGSGKSHFAEHFDPGNTYAFPDLNRRERLNIDNYNGERTIVIEDYDGAITFRTLLRILDIYNVELNTKGDFAPADWNNVIITANSHPTTWYNNDVDSWGGDNVSPLQRRIHYLIEAKGTYPTVEYLWNGTETTTELPTLKEGEEMQEQNKVDDIAKEVEEILQDLKQQQQDEENDFMKDILPTEQVEDAESDRIIFGEDGDQDPGGEDLFTGGKFNVF